MTIKCMVCPHPGNNPTSDPVRWSARRCAPADSASVRIACTRACNSAVAPMVVGVLTQASPRFRVHVVQDVPKHAALGRMDTDHAAPAVGSPHQDVNECPISDDTSSLNAEGPNDLLKNRLYSVWPGRSPG
jgi:hypothetical protein